MALAGALALARPPEPLALVPVRAVWTLALNSHLAVPPAYDETRAFFGLEQNVLAAYDVPTGKRLWLADARPIFAGVATEGMLVLAEADALVALRAADGSTLWRTPLAEPLAARPAASPGAIVATTKSGSVAVFRSHDGAVVWQRDLGSPARAPAAIGAGRVYIPSADGRIVALAAETGEPVWERRIGGSPNEILLAGDRLFVGSTDNFFYCLMAKDGRIDWRWRTGGDVIGMPAADAQLVYFVSLDNVLRALNQKSGGQRWMRALPLRPTSGPKLAGATLIVAGQSPTIATFNAKDGAPSVDIAAGDDVIAPPQILAEPVTGVPMIVVVTRNIARADSVALSVRSIDPIPAPVGPLPNLVTLAPTLPTPP